MKATFFIPILSLLVSTGYSQIHKLEISHYIFPEFRKGTVLMKAGGSQATMLNYNSLTEEMIFDQNGKKLAIGPVSQIDTIYIEGRKFFPLKEKFVEIIYHNKYDLYAAHRCRLVDPGKPAAYGGTSQTSSTTTYSTFMSGGQLYELSLPEGFGTNPYTDYWLKKDGKLSQFTSLRQLSKLFDDKPELFKKYVKENKVTYENQEGILALIKYMEKQ